MLTLTYTLTYTLSHPLKYLLSHPISRPTHPLTHPCFTPTYPTLYSNTLSHTPSHTLSHTLFHTHPLFHPQVTNASSLVSCSAVQAAFTQTVTSQEGLCGATATGMLSHTPLPCPLLTHPYHALLYALTHTPTMPSSHTLGHT